MDTQKFELEGKALTTTPTASGDLIVTGYAAWWAGQDFEDENFDRSAFTPDVISAYLGNQAPILFAHNGGKGIGRCIELVPDDKGLQFKAVVQRQEPSSPLYYIYDGIRRGVYRGVSVAGHFRRTLTAQGRKITGVRIGEISIAPMAMHPGTFATAVEVKARRDASPVLDDLDLRIARVEVMAARQQIRDLRMQVMLDRADLL